jgi:hypothetical protein
MDSLYLKLLKSLEESASGYIPSDAEKDDPRYKTALTVDIKPDTMQKNASKLGSKIARDGRPPLMRKGSINVKENMKNIKETTTAGSVATVANPSSKNAGSLFKGTKTREKFINSKEIKEMLNDELARLTEALDPSYFTSASIQHYNLNEKIMEDIRVINKLLKSDPTEVNRKTLNRYLKPLYHHLLITHDDRENKLKKMAKDHILLSSDDNTPVEAHGYYYKNDRRYVFTQTFKSEESLRKAAEKHNLTILDIKPVKTQSNIMKGIK